MPQVVMTARIRMQSGRNVARRQSILLFEQKPELLNIASYMSIKTILNIERRKTLENRATATIFGSSIKLSFKDFKL